MTTQQNKTGQKYNLTRAVAVAVGLSASMAFAGQCDTVRFSDIGWTDITATTAVTSEVVEGLGSKSTTQLRSVPVTYTSLANADIDVFLSDEDFYHDLLGKHFSVGVA